MSISEWHLIGKTISKFKCLNFLPHGWVEDEKITYRLSIYKRSPDPNEHFAIVAQVRLSGRRGSEYCNRNDKKVFLKLTFTDTIALTAGNYNFNSDG